MILICPFLLGIFYDSEKSLSKIRSLVFLYPFVTKMLRHGALIVSNDSGKIIKLPYSCHQSYLYTQQISLKKSNNGFGVFFCLCLFLFFFMVNQYLIFFLPTDNTSLPQKKNNFQKTTNIFVDSACSSKTVKCQ